ncbi:non-specific lipid-transfer protein A-like [Coffea eugenioides]|uniref:non-specific lipid-transfer protein A-like n=1 Tax=Coffea eugenioides TaxID=49369 RepID=UPI000F605968|nr:non-specific lipid-transfer protein A-like [Coffea eugenioides]
MGKKTIPDSFIRWMGMVVLALVVSPGIATKSAFDCRTLLGLLAPCQPFFFSHTRSPSPDCCVGAQALGIILESSEPNMKSSCYCLKGAGRLHAVPPPVVNQFVSSCNIHINMTIDRNFNCSIF